MYDPCCTTDSFLLRVVCKTVFQSLHLCFWVCLGFFVPVFSDKCAGGRGQVKLVGMPLSCRAQVRRAGVSRLPVYASEEEKALNSPAVVLLSTSGDGAYEESFLVCPQLMVCGLTILFLNRLCFLGCGREEKKNGKKKLEKKNPPDC